MENNVSDILKSADIQPTAFRIQVAGILLNSNKALSTKDIEEQLNTAPDRVTLYRTLKLFVDKHFAHKIEVSDAHIVYQLKPFAEPSIEEHAHFHCTKCDAVYCLPQTPIVPPALPDGFELHHNKLLVDGTCGICNKKFPANEK
jgi:Fur family ferric uptake transcriptional regulator